MSGETALFALLKEVSRSFYISVRFLPKRIRLMRRPGVAMTTSEPLAICLRVRRTRSRTRIVCRRQNESGFWSGFWNALRAAKCEAP